MTRNSAAPIYICSDDEMMMPKPKKKSKAKRRGAGASDTIFADDVDSEVDDKPVYQLSKRMIGALDAGWMERKKLFCFVFFFVFLLFFCFFFVF